MLFGKPHALISHSSCGYREQGHPCVKYYRIMLSDGLKISGMLLSISRTTELGLYV